MVVKHPDFNLTVESVQFAKAWAKAVANVREENLMSRYNWSGGVQSVVRKTAGGAILLEKGADAPAVFFDNTDYPLWIEFNEEIRVREASFEPPQQNENDNFSFHRRRQILSGFLNYGNEIGKSDITINYILESGEKRQFRFYFEVLSTKLDYHEHWRQIIKDIEAEYRMLSLDFMKRTYHSFSLGQERETPDLIWWNIFKSEQEKFIKACKAITDRPRHRLRGSEANLRADRIRVFSPALETEFAEHRKEASRLYRTEEQTLSNDTPENRFLKHALSRIAEKYDLLRKRIESVAGSTAEQAIEMKEKSRDLNRLARHPFFKTVGAFKGLAQESMVLQRATGYSQVYRIWILLRQAYSLNEGLYHLETKDIATLYEIWCFIELKNIVAGQLGHDVEVDHRNRMDLNKRFTYELGKGEQSRVLFRKDGVELAELVYNPKNTEKENDDISIEHLVSRTVPQKPDIVLQLTKDDLEKGMKMTYLFDAKYRIAGKKKGADTPPDDAINQMHRYRDAIYYQKGKDAALKKEVIGGYILFPGDGLPANVQAARFYKSIAEVNIGAFPLRPKDEANRTLLKEFINGLVGQKGCETVTRTIPQKGTVVTVRDRVLVGIVKSKEEEFEAGKGKIYYTGSQFPTTISLDNLHHFAPYIKGKGVRDIYEITKIRTIAGKEVKAGSGDDLRLAFELGKCTRFFEDYKMVGLPVSYSFNDSTFDKLRQDI